MGTLMALAIVCGAVLIISFTSSRHHSVMAARLAHEISKHGVSPAGALVDDVDDPPRKR
jgi:hypothetical protein